MEGETPGRQKEEKKVRSETGKGGEHCNEKAHRQCVPHPGTPDREESLRKDSFFFVKLMWWRKSTQRKLHKNSQPEKSQEEVLSHKNEGYCG